MLTPAQHTLIDKHLRSDNWLLNNDLIAELTDHYVDAISDKLAEGIPFDLALQDVHRSFGGRKGLLAMEEKYVKAQEQTNLRVYKQAMREAFQWPGIGYVLSAWVGCYGLLQSLSFISPSEKFADFRSGFVLGLLAVMAVMFVYAFVLMYKQLREGTFSLRPAAAPTFVVIQSVIWIVQLSLQLPVRAFFESQPMLCALVLTLIGIHVRAGGYAVYKQLRYRCLDLQLVELLIRDNGW
jgi:hypothetical protein